MERRSPVDGDRGVARLRRGVGLAVAVLLDATVVRACLLPATMKLLGPRNWYLPRWLGWLPRAAWSEPQSEPSARQQPPVTVVGP